MAYRDKSQGFAFVYDNLKEAYDDLMKKNPIVKAPRGKTVNFNKDKKPTKRKRRTSKVFE